MLACYEVCDTEATVIGGGLNVPKRSEHPLFSSGGIASKSFIGNIINYSVGFSRVAL